MEVEKLVEPPAQSVVLDADRVTDVGGEQGGVQIVILTSP